MKKIFKTVRTVVNCLIIALLLAAVFFVIYCNINNSVPYIFGNAAVRILTGSMEPEIKAGEYIMVEKVKADEIEVGDVILFYSKDPTIYGQLNTHRVIGINNIDGQITFSTKGDNNTLKDKYDVSEADISGRYVRRLEKLTAIYNIVRQPIFFLVIIIVPALILLVSSAYDIRKKCVDVKHEELVEAEIKRIEKEMRKKAEEGGGNACKASDKVENQTVQKENRDA